MASSSKMDDEGEGETLEEEFERFDDFTLAFSWERFISKIEAVWRLWLADGSKNLLILHYLETLRVPHQLHEKMVCTAFRASADSLKQTSFGG